MISKLKNPRISLLPAIFLCMCAAVSAQDARPADAAPGDRQSAQRESKPNLLLELGLTREQVRAVRRLNLERKPAEQEARRRFRDANRDLNMAIYADTVDDSAVQTRLKEFQAAQADLARIKFTSELAVRKLLTPEQLNKFRTLRQQFAEAREEMDRSGSGPGSRPALRRLRRRNPPPTSN